MRKLSSSSARTSLSLPAPGSRVGIIDKSGVLLGDLESTGQGRGGGQLGLGLNLGKIKFVID